MTEPRYMAIDLMRVINDAVEKHHGSDEQVTFGEILFALRVCASVIVSELPEERRAEYVQGHMIATAEMLGIPLIPMEVDAPDRGKMN